MSEHEEEVQLIPRQDLASTLVSQIENIHLKLDILALDLNREIFAREDFIRQLRLWVLDCPRAQVRIFVKASQRSMMRGNPLIELGLNLTSYFQFREPAPQQRIELDEMLLLDQRTAITWSDRQPDIRLITEAPLKVAPLQLAFDDCWQQGQASQQIRNLNI